MKKVIISILLLIFSTIIFSWIFFPYQSVFSHYSEKVIVDYKLPISYSGIEADRGNALFHDVSLLGRMPFDIGDIKFSYSLMTLFTRSIAAEIDGEILKGEVDLSLTNITFTIQTDLGKLNISGKDDLLKGDIFLNGKIDLSNNEGNFDVTSDKLIVKSDMGPITLHELKGNAVYANKILTISDLSSTGKTKISVKGKIYINTRNIGASRLQLTGKLDFSGLKQNINISGTINKPRVKMK